MELGPGGVAVTITRCPVCGRWVSDAQWYGHLLAHDDESEEVPPEAIEAVLAGLVCLAVTRSEVRMSAARERWGQLRRKFNREHGGEAFDRLCREIVAEYGLAPYLLDLDGLIAGEPEGPPSAVLN